VLFPILLHHGLVCTKGLKSVLLAGIGYMAGCRLLVTMSVWGLEAGSGFGHSDPQRPTAIYRLYFEAHFTYNWDWGSRFLSVG
jgi:hypothetical protein